MKLISFVFAAALCAGQAVAQAAPASSIVPLGPLPKSAADQQALLHRMSDYSLGSCGIAILLQVTPSAFPNDNYDQPIDLADRMGTYFAERFSLSTRIYLVERESGAPSAMAFVNGHMFARALDVQTFTLEKFTAMGPGLAINHHSIKRMKSEILQQLVAQSEGLIAKLEERLALEERAKDLAGVQLLLRGVEPETVTMTSAERANPRTDLQRAKADYLRSVDAIEAQRKQLAEEQAGLADVQAGLKDSRCAFAAPDKLYGFDDIETLRNRVAADREKPPGEISDAAIWGWIVETGFGTPLFEG